ncbi:MAG: alpha/beta fold hydrolase [Rhodothermales bacterium]
MRPFLPIAVVSLLFLFVACRSDAPLSAHEDGYLVGADSAKLFYRVAGTGEDTLVIVHGGPGAGMNTVFPSIIPLADRYVLIFFDQRGGGRSTLPADTSKLRPEYFVADLDSVRRHFGLDRMNVITHSFGSVLLARYALTHPDRLGRVVLHGATGPRRAEAGRIIRARAAAAPPSPDTTLSNRAAELLRDLLNGTASNAVQTCREYEEITRMLAIARGERVTHTGSECDAPPDAVAYYYRHTAQLAPKYFGDWNFTAGLEDFTAPLLVVYGEMDSLAISEQRDWASAVAKGRLLLVPVAGKPAFSDNPDFVFPAIDTFFRGAWPAAAQKVDGSQP